MRARTKNEAYVNNIASFSSLISLSSLNRSMPRLSASYLHTGLSGSLPPTTQRLKNDPTLDLPSPMYQSIALNNVDEVRGFIEADDSSVNEILTHGKEAYRPLGLAAQRKHYSLVRLLIDNGADPSLTSRVHRGGGLTDLTSLEIEDFFDSNAFGESTKFIENYIRMFANPR